MRRLSSLVCASAVAAPKAKAAAVIAVIDVFMMAVPKTMTAPMLRAGFLPVVSTNHASFCRAHRTSTSARRSIASTREGARVIAVEENARREYALLGDCVGAQALRERDERRDAARFGTSAPVLELAQQLLLRGARAIPEGGELVAHGERDLERTGLLERLGHFVCLGAGQRLAAQQSAPERAQHLGITG